MTSIKPTRGPEGPEQFSLACLQPKRERLSGQERELECLLWRGWPALEPEETCLVLLQSARVSRHSPKEI